MDSILETHLKKVFVKKPNNTNASKKSTKTSNAKNSKIDPILEKHLANIFLNNEEISRNLKEAAELKRKNEEVLKEFSNVIENKANSPVKLKINKSKKIIIPEIADVNKNIAIPKPQEIRPPTIIDAYKTAIQVQPHTLKPETEEDPANLTMQDMYVQTIKDSDSEPRISHQESSDDEFFAFLDRNKSNPKLKNFFNLHSESMKKEILKISENFTKEKMLIASESGGGSGNITINNGTNGADRGKFVEVIGNGVDREYVVTHNLATKDSVVSLYNANTDELVISSVTHINENQTKLYFADPISSNSIKVVIIG